MKLTIWYQFYCESARLIESWYLMPWDVYCPADTADITILWGSLYHIWNGVRAWLSAKTFQELDLLPWRGWLVVVTEENCQMSVLESSLATYALSVSGSWTGICEMVWDSKCLSSRNLLIWQHLSSLSLVSSQSGLGTGPLTLWSGEVRQQGMTGGGWYSANWLQNMGYTPTSREPLRNHNLKLFILDLENQLWRYRRPGVAGLGSRWLWPRLRVLVCI